VEFFVGRGEFPSYAINVYFEARDLIIQYYSYDLRKGLQICPLISDFSIVRLWFGPNPENPPLPGVSLEEATSLTLADFANLMSGDLSKACLDLNAEVFD
jgi:hypothetical protein